MKKELKREYNFEDTYLTELCGTMHLIFLDGLADFTAFDADFDAAFATQWDNLTTACIAFPSDESLGDEEGGLTVYLKRAVDDALKTRDDMAYYVNKKWGKDTTKAKEFGIDTASKKNINPITLSMRLRVMHTIATDYAAELATVNMPPAVAAALLTHSQNILDKEHEQEVFKCRRIKTTQDRIKQLNELWHYYKRVHDAAQVVYYNDEVRRNQWNTKKLFT